MSPALAADAMAAVDRVSVTVVRVGLIALAGLLLWHAYHFVAGSMRAVAYPHELDYGEGIVWFQVQQLFAGEAFGDIHIFPAVVFHYTPLFHFVSGLVAALGIDPLAAGRIVSLLSTAAMVILIGAIVRHVILQSHGTRRTAYACAAIAGLTLLVAFPVKIWAPLMRVDMLAFALTLAGIYAGLRAIRQPAWIYLAAFFFVLAVYAKQTMIAAPASVFLVLLLYRPRTAVKGIFTCLIAGSIVLAALAYATDGGFLRHVFLYNVNRIDLGRIEQIGIIAFGHIFLIMAALVGVAATVPALRRFTAHRRKSTPQDAAHAMVGCYLLLTTIMLLLVLKSGSSANYFIEWFAVLAIYVGFATRIAVERSFGVGTTIATETSFTGKLAVAALCAQALFLAPDQYSARLFQARAPGLAQLTEMVRQSKWPVISDDMVVVMRAGRPVLWEPAIFTELAATGVWDETPFVRMIEQRRFAFFIIYQGRGGNSFSQRYSPAVAAAIEKAYPRQENIAGLTVHYPR